jgi:transcriptional regulator of arginine metabolism
MRLGRRYQVSELNLAQNRSARLQLISSLIAEKKLRSQRELGIALEELGYNITQPTLSRDLDDLSVRKDKAGFYYIASAEDLHSVRLQRSMRDLLISAESSGQLLVLRTPPGGAQLLASAIDQSKISGVLGTIAGDDTVLLITSGPTAATEITKHFLNLAKSNVYKEKE